MKGFLFSILLFSAFSIKAQVLQRSQGFPADPVTALSWCEDTLYIGTQGSGVFVLVEQRILPSRRFKEFSRSTIYKFQDCEPVASGTLQAYPITASSPDGTTYTAEDGSLRIQFSDEGARVDERPPGAELARGNLGDDVQHRVRSFAAVLVRPRRVFNLDRRRLEGAPRHRSFGRAGWLRER